MDQMQGMIMLFNAQVGQKGSIKDRTHKERFRKFYGRDINIMEEY